MNLGGGAFITEVLESGGRSAAIDHRPQTVQLTRGIDRQAVRAGRFKGVEAEAHRIPSRDGRLSCVATTNAFESLADSVASLPGISRVLAPEGRFVVLAVSETPAGKHAAPSPRLLDSLERRR